MRALRQLPYPATRVPRGGLISYAVKEIFATLQGEGFHALRPAIFLRFAGCNLWSGREADRADAICRFCDTDFVGGDSYRTAEELAGAVAEAGAPRFVVVTGGEPLLQLDEPLVGALHDQGFEIAIETNGTLLPPDGIDWICVSPKAEAGLRLERGDELKLVYPQAGPGGAPERYADLDFRHFFLQPMDGPDRERNTALAAGYCEAHPRWKVSLQAHKLLGIP